LYGFIEICFEIIEVLAKESSFFFLFIKDSSSLLYRADCPIAISTINPSCDDVAVVVFTNESRDCTVDSFLEIVVVRDICQYFLE